MPDAKSLLPGRAFRSEHAQLRPEPHSIASHGPAPMDPLQTTRMRNGVLYAAEWPCCHDPLRLSLGSVDPFTPLARVGARPGAARAPGPHPAASHPQANARARDAPRAQPVREPRARSAQARACVPWMAQPPRRPPSLPPGRGPTRHPRHCIPPQATPLRAPARRPARVCAAAAERPLLPSLHSPSPLADVAWDACAGAPARRKPPNAHHLVRARPSPPFTRNQHTSRRAKERGRTPQLSLSAASACSSCVHAPRGPHHARVESNDLTPPEPPSLKPPSEYSPPQGLVLLRGRPGPFGVKPEPLGARRGASGHRLNLFGPAGRSDRPRSRATPPQ